MSKKAIVCTSPPIARGLYHIKVINGSSQQENKTAGRCSRRSAEKASPPCRASQSFEPAYAGGNLTYRFSLASRGYRIPSREPVPLTLGVGSKRVATSRTQQGDYSLAHFQKTRKLARPRIAPVRTILHDFYTRSSQVFHNWLVSWESDQIFHLTHKRKCIKLMRISSRPVWVKHLTSGFSLSISKRSCHRKFLS